MVVCDVHNYDVPSEAIKLMSEAIKADSESGTVIWLLVRDAPIVTD